jgi:hypothetical protein
VEERKVLKVWIPQSGIWLVLFVLHLPALCLAGPPPVINVQPSDQSVLINDTTTFSVTASSGTTLWYQWYKDGNLLLGATASSLTLTQVKSSYEGAYSVKVSNIYGSVASSNAILTVLVPPSISSQPQSQTVMQGRSAVFYVGASGSMPFTYQWAMNGLPMPGATDRSLLFTNAQPFNAGNYTITVSNSAGSVTSSAASLTVLPASPASFSGAQMTPAGFKCQLSVSSGFTYLISASTNLQDWTPISTNTATSNSLTVTDPTATNYLRRFYRATAQVYR